MSVLESRRTLFLYMAAGASFSALSARGLLVPLYALEVGAGRFTVGALFSASTLAAALLSLPAGLLIDRFGTRKLLWFSIVLSSASQLGTAATPAVVPLFIWQVTGGLAVGAQQAALFSAVTEAVPGNRLGRAMGWLTFAMQTGFLVGPLIAGLLLTWLPPRTDIAVTTALLLLAAPGAMAATDTQQAEGRPHLIAPLRALLGQPAFVPVIIGLVSATLVWGTVGAFLPIFGKQGLSLSGTQIGLLIALQAVANGLARIPAGRLADRARQRWPIVFVGVIVWSAATIVLGRMTGFWAPAVLLLVATPFVAAAFVAMGVSFGNLSVASTRGVTMGTYGTVLFLALGVGPLLFGPLMQIYGYAAGFTVCACVAIVLALAMAALHAEPLQRRSAVPLPPAAPGT